MTHPRRVTSPRILPPPRYGLRAFFVFLLLLAVGAAIGAAFFAGAAYEREASLPLVEEVRVVEGERDSLAAEVAELKQQNIRLERSQQIDREASKIAANQLKEAQDDRLAVEKEVSFLRRLIQEGGGGILQPKDFKLKETGEPRRFAYSFTIQQLIPGFGESVGSVEIKVLGKHDGEEQTLTLDKLEGSAPAVHKMEFNHFQSFEGIVQLPEGFEAENLVVEIKPKTAKLIPVSETFPWSIE